MALPPTLAAPGVLTGSLTAAQRIAQGLRGAGALVGGATQQAAENRAVEANQGLEANAQNISGQSGYETQLLNRAKLEADQRKSALQDAARASYFTNRQSGPFNPRPPAAMSPAYTQSLSALEQQALRRLQTRPQYETETMDPLKPYVPYVPRNQPGGRPGSLERVGNWLAPGLTLAGMFAGR